MTHENFNTIPPKTQDIIDTCYLSPVEEYYDGEKMQVKHALAHEAAWLLHLEHEVAAAVESDDLERMRQAWRSIAEYLADHKSTRNPGEGAGYGGEYWYGHK